MPSGHNDSDSSDSDSNFSEQSFEVIYRFGGNSIEGEIMTTTLVAEHSLGSSGSVGALDELTRPYEDTAVGDQDPPEGEDLTTADVEQDENVRENHITDQEEGEDMTTSTEGMEDVLQSLETQKQIGRSLVEGLTSSHQSFKSFIENFTKTDSQSNLQAILSHHLNTIPTRILVATVIGFTISFLFFLSYTVIIETHKSKQLQQYANMTKEERAHSENYRQGQDSLRELLMHKSYEEARLSHQELESCRNQEKLLERQLAAYKANEINYKNKIAQLETQIISRAGVDSKLNELKAVALKLKDETLVLNREVEKYRGWLVGGVVLFGLFVVWGRIRVSGGC